MDRYEEPVCQSVFDLDFNDQENCRLPSFDPLSAPPSLLLHIPPYSQLIWSFSPLFLHFSFLSCDLSPFVSVSLHPAHPLWIILPLSTSTLPSICLVCLSRWTCIFHNHFHTLLLLPVVNLGCSVWGSRYRCGPQHPDKLYTPLFWYW